MSPLDVVAAIVVGFLSGVLSGMFGVGGAVVTTPGIRALGASPIQAVGSTIPAILPGAVSGAWRYNRSGLVDWRIALTCGVIGSSFAVAGGIVSDHVDGHYLMLLTAGLVLYTGLLNISGSRKAAVLAAEEAALVPASDDAVAAIPALDVEPPPPNLAVVAVIGALAGMLAGLLGVGGGILMVPAFTSVLKMPPKRAVATSLVGVAIFSIPAMITHTVLGHIHWGYALALVLGVVPGAQVGAHITIIGSERRLRLLMGIFFTVLALAYGIAELRSL